MKTLSQWAALSLLLVSFAVQSQQPIRINIGFVAGSAPDTLARLIGERMRDTLGRVVLVDNKPGAAGRIAVDATRTAAPDGSTLMMVPNGPMTLFPWIFKGLSFDPVRDFTPLSLVTLTDLVLVTGPATTARTVAELRDWMRANPGRANFGSGGTGTILHFIGVAFSQAIGVPMQHIPYKGSVLAVNDVMAGQIAMAVSSTVETAELHRAGKVRIIAVTGGSRLSFAPDIPTLKESGVDVDLSAWFALYGPAGMPAALANTYSRAVATALADARVKETLAKLNQTPVGSTPDELAQRQAREFKAWESIIKASGFTPTD